VPAATGDNPHRLKAEIRLPLLGERGGTTSTGLGLNDLDGWGGKMGKVRGKQTRIENSESKPKPES
jgi:hypothetical protein